MRFCAPLTRTRGQFAARGSILDVSSSFPRALPAVSGQFSGGSVFGWHHGRGVPSIFPPCLSSSFRRSSGWPFLSARGLRVFSGRSPIFGWRFGGVLGAFRSGFVFSAGAGARLSFSLDSIGHPPYSPPSREIRSYSPDGFSGNGGQIISLWQTFFSLSPLTFADTWYMIDCMVKGNSSDLN